MRSTEGFLDKESAPGEDAVRMVDMTTKDLRVSSKLS